MYKTVPHPLQCSCLENPRDGGAWWAAVYGVAQSRTRLKWLSSSSSSSAKDIGLNNFLVEADWITLIPCFWVARGSRGQTVVTKWIIQVSWHPHLCSSVSFGCVAWLGMWCYSSVAPPPSNHNLYPSAPGPNSHPCGRRLALYSDLHAITPWCRWSLSPGCCLSPSPTSVLHCQPSLASLPSQLFYCWSL